MSYSVIELQKSGIIRVEDGNHGEYRPRPSEFVEKGVAFIRAADLDGGTVSFDKASKINANARRRITKGIGRPGDIIISHKGTIGKTARAPTDSPEFVCSPQTTFWRSLDAEKLSQEYLYVLMRSPRFQADFAVRSGETDMAGYVSLTSQRHLRIPIPPINVQQRIAEVVGSLDDKIELNRRTNETLEAMAQAIFRDWFVDFGPTRRQMEGATDPVQIMGGLTPDPEKAATLAPLFPATLADNGLPEGWEAKPLDEIADFLNGLALQKFPVTDPSDSLPVIKIAELRNGLTGNTSRASREVPAKYVIRDGDFLFSWSGSLLAKFWTAGEGALNQHLFKVTSETYPAWFYTQWVHHHLEEFQRIAASKATTMGHIQRRHLNAAATTCPPIGDIESMGHLLAPIVEMAIQHDLQNRALAATRDLLLPRLMSGELRLSQI